MSNHPRLLLSPLGLLIALTAVLGPNASSASADGGLETRVRAFDHVIVDAVGQPSSKQQVGELLAEMLANSVVVVVDDDGDVEVVSGSDVGDAGGDGRVQGVGAEETDGR